MCVCVFFFFFFSARSMDPTGICQGAFLKASSPSVLWKACRSQNYELPSYSEHRVYGFSALGFGV